MGVPGSIAFEQQETFDLSANTHTTTPSTSETFFLMSTQSSEDTLQSLHTALCFLTSVNADVKEVVSFLTAHPASLLLEGIGFLNEESAQYIVSSRMKDCYCSRETCRGNRVRVLDTLRKGFEYFDLLHGREESTTMSLESIEELTQLERQVRAWRNEEELIRHRLCDIRRQLSYCKSQSSRKHVTIQRKSSCKAVVLSSEFVSVEREYCDLLQHIKRARRAQFATLKREFSRCKRHVCRSRTLPIASMREHQSV